MVIVIHANNIFTFSEKTWVVAEIAFAFNWFEFILFLFWVFVLFFVMFYFFYEWKSKNLFWQLD